MTVERVNKEILIRLPDTFELQKVQAIVEYFRMLEIVQKSSGSERAAANLSRQADKTWWEANKHKFLK